MLHVSAEVRNGICFTLCSLNTLKLSCGFGLQHASAEMRKASMMREKLQEVHTWVGHQALPKQLKGAIKAYYADVSNLLWIADIAWVASVATPTSLKLLLHAIMFCGHPLLHMFWLIQIVTGKCSCCRMWDAAAAALKTAHTSSGLQTPTMQTMQTSAAFMQGGLSDLELGLGGLSDATVVDSRREGTRGLVMCGCGSPGCACCSCTCSHRGLAGPCKPCRHRCLTVALKMSGGQGRGRPGAAKAICRMHQPGPDQSCCSA